MTDSSINTSFANPTNAAYMGGYCGDSCTQAGVDVAGALLPVLAGATAIFCVAKYCLGRIDVSLEGKRKGQDALNARDMRSHRQEGSTITQILSMTTISMIALVMIAAVINSLPALGLLSGLVLMSMIGGGAVVLTNMVHDRLALHDGRPMQG